VKLLAIVQAEPKTGRANLVVDHTGTVPVSGAPPRPALLELDCPGLSAPTRAGLLRWLATQGERVAEGTATKGSAAGALDAVPEHAWRPITFDEAVDLRGFEQLQYLAGAAAPLAEIVVSLRRRLPPLLDATDAGLELEDAAQIASLTGLAPVRRAAGTVMWAMNIRSDRHVLDLSERVDRAGLAALRGRPFDVDAWVSAADAMKAPIGRLAALVELVSRIPEGDDAPTHALAIVRAVRRHRQLVLATAFAPAFWGPLAPLLDWAPTMRAGTLSLENANEAVVTASWDLWNARRVGRVKIGRKALVIPGGIQTVIRGTRALVKRVIDAGGELRHHGVTLTYPTTARPLTPRLVEVERIDTLAYVDPDAALRVIGERGDVPALRALVERAKTDRGLARVLADHLIEHAVGLDADVARKLARGHW
jgi:hypothetical protein